MKITKLEPSKHKAGRWLVWLEDGSLIRLGEGDVVALSLYAGKELTENETENLTAAAEQSRLNGRALELIAARPMSRKELVDKLSAPSRRRKKPGADDTAPDPEAAALERERLREDAARAADRLEELGLLNDGEYARTVVRHYAAKGYGVRKLRDELYRRGVPKDHWEEALAELEPDDTAVDRLLERKLRGAEPTRENLKRASDYLARRGYGWEEISAAIERYRERG